MTCANASSELSAEEIDDFVNELLVEFNEDVEVASATQHVDAKPFVTTLETSLSESDTFLELFGPESPEIDNSFTLTSPLVESNKFNFNQLKVPSTVNPNKEIPAFDVELSDFELLFDDDDLQKLIDDCNQKGFVSSPKETEFNPVYTPPLLKSKKRVNKGITKTPKRTRTVNVNKKVELNIDFKTEARISHCLHHLHCSSNYNNQIAAMEGMVPDDAHVIDRSVYERAMMLFVLPNNVTIEDFEKHQNNDGWTYLSNKIQTLERLPMRLCGQRANFYEPFVKREKRVGEETIREALCPYCQVDYNNLDLCFYNVSASNYQHHVVKNHGVWNAGYEMPPPVIFKKDNKFAAVCGRCGEHPVLSKVNFTDLNCRDSLQNQLIGYYRHHFSKHPIQKKGSVRDRIVNEKWFITKDPQMDQMVYEAAD